MRVLLVHNFYGSGAPSGENLAFLAERDLLTSRGHDVVEFVRHSDSLRSSGIVGLIRGAASTPWNPVAAHEVSRHIRRFQPDIVHAHNTFPSISPSIFHAIKAPTASVLTLHNYRILCPAAIPMRGGQVCTQCIDKKSVVPALRHGCYRGSRIATLPIAINVAMHRYVGTWTKKVDAFIALTEFQKGLYAGAGLPQGRIHVKPNFYPGNPLPVRWVERPRYVVFVGRLSHEKGLKTLISAWRELGSSAPELRIIGDGPMRHTLEQLSRGLHVSFLGQLRPDLAQKHIACSRLLVLPSECFEGFPMTIREAFAWGTPVLASDIGPLPSIIKPGIAGDIFRVGDSTSLRDSVQRLWSCPMLLEELARGARKEFDELYNDAAAHRKLLDIYATAIDFRKSTVQ